MSRMYFVKKETIYRCYFIALCYNIIISKLFYRHEEVVIRFKAPLAVRALSPHCCANNMSNPSRDPRDYLPIRRGGDLMICEVTGSIDILLYCQPQDFLHVK